MRICYLCNEYPPSRHGGIGTFTQVQSEAMVRSGHEVRVIGVYRDDDPASDYGRPQGVQVWRLRSPGYRMGWLAGRYRLYRQVAEWCRRGEVDLVDAPDYEGWIAYWPALAVPVVCRMHGSQTFFAAELGHAIRQLAYHLEWASVRRADFCCSPSQYAADRTRWLLGCGARPIEVIPYGVDLPEFLPSLRRTPGRAIFTGTLTPKKGVLHLARAWSEVVRRRPDAELHWLGKDGRAPGGGSMQELLRTQVDQRTADRMVFHGHQPRERLFDMLSHASVAVFPSHAETFGLGPAEAMACGCPTIYSRRGPGPELIRDDQDGLLIDPDRPEELVASILTVFDNEELARRLGRAGRQRIEQTFAIKSLAARNEAFYASCIDHFRRARRHAA